MKFIDNLKSQVIDGYSEKHQIIPKSMGGTDDRSNLIALTPRQHFVAHWMLWKAYGGSMARAYFMMSATGKYGKIGSKTYAMARKEYSKQVVIQMAKKPNIPAFTPEHRQKLRMAKLGKKLSPQHRENVRLAVLGRKCSTETRQKISATKKEIFMNKHTPLPAENE